MVHSYSGGCTYRLHLPYNPREGWKFSKTGGKVKKNEYGGILELIPPPPYYANKDGLIWSTAPLWILQEFQGVVQSVGEDNTKKDRSESTNIWLSGKAMLWEV